jgi:hypothetical protein
VRLPLDWGKGNTPAEQILPRSAPVQRHHPRGMPFEVSEVLARLDVVDGDDARITRRGEIS